MKQLKSTVSELRQLFKEGVTVSYIASPFKYFEIDESPTSVRAYMEEHDYDVVGVRKNGIEIGYININKLSLQEGTIEDSLVSFSSTELVSETTPLKIVFEMLRDSQKIFVLFHDKVEGIVTRGDLQKAPIRMWLFSLISLLEMQLLRLVRSYYPDEEWKNSLTPKRLCKAQELFNQRKAKNQNIDLADCLQLCDKRDIVIKSEVIRKQIGIEKNTGKRLLKRIEDLRDNLAHAQDIVTGAWPEIVGIAGSIEDLLEKCEQVDLSRNSSINNCASQYTMEVYER